MIRLRCAVLSHNMLATTILDSLPSYSHLRELSLGGLIPTSFFQHNVTLPLSRLCWEFDLELWRGRQPNPIPKFLENAVKLCPHLISLEVVNGGYSISHKAKDEILPWPPKSENCLSNLQQLILEGVYDRLPRDDESSHEHPFYLPTFIHRHRKSLKSLMVSVNADFTSANNDWARRICVGLPNLTSLTLHSESNKHSSRSYNQVKWVVSELTESNPLLERFSATCIGSHFRSSFSKLFKPFTKLKTLYLGDGENRDGPFASDHRISFPKYDLVWTALLPSPSTY